MKRILRAMLICGAVLMLATPAHGAADHVRLSGSGRCQTAVAAAEELKATLGVERFDAIIIASGNNFADALAGSYLAAVKSAPILLYQNTSSVYLNLRAICTHLVPEGTVYLLGGTSAVPEDMEAAVRQAGFTVKRLSGAGRCETNLAILAEAGIAAGQEILVSTAYNFADSLSASATGKPILLLNTKTGALTSDQIRFLSGLSGSKLTILGGTGAVGAEWETLLGRYGEVTRLSGRGREETSALIAGTYFPHTDTVLLAASGNFPDGLSGGPVAYAKGAPLLLTRAGREAAAAAYVSEHEPTEAYVLGGKSALSDEVVRRVLEPGTPSDFWNDVFPMPSASEIAAYTNPTNSRGPYIAGWLDIDRTDRFVEYAIDFKADYLPEGTYCCVAQWRMDLSSLEKQYSNVHTEYSSVHAYAGFQNTSNRGKVSLMSFWDIYGTDANGMVHTFRPKVVYPENGEGSFGGEGTGAQCFVPYEWEAGRWYRMLLQTSKSQETGNTQVQQWVCDLSTGVWTHLCTYDTGLKDSCFMGPVAVFLENYSKPVAGEIRSLELKNVRIHREGDAHWTAIKKSYLGPNGGLPKYSGSYAFGTEADRFWMITSGVGGDWYGNGKGQKGGNFTVSTAETGKPY